MEIKQVVGGKVVVIFTNDLRLEGKVEAVDDEGFGFVTSKKSSYVTFSDV
jgi:hypothetical protein